MSSFRSDALDAVLEQASAGVSSVSPADPDSAGLTTEVRKSQSSFVSFDQIYDSVLPGGG